MKKIAAAREVAFAVLREVTDGGYASDLLREQTAALSSRDAGLTSQLVLGSLRVQNQLDFLINRYSGRASGTLDLDVLLAMRLAIYQLRYLDRIPPHAAVNDSVEYVKQKKRAASGLVNAVLRKANREEMKWPTDELRYACPAWLLDRWAAHFGVDEARAIAAAALKEPEAYVRLKSTEEPRADWEPTEVPGCYRVSGPVDGLRLHDISSQTIVPLIGIERHHFFLDLCAAPGNKSVQALESCPALVAGCDVSERRLRMVESSVNRILLDAERPLPFTASFDRVLIDAPCSGTGTLGRNPEIKWRLQQSDLKRQHARQIGIMNQAASVLKPGGKIVFATCSLEEEENEKVIQHAVKELRLRLDQERWRMPGRESGDGFYAAVLTKGSTG